MHLKPQNIKKVTAFLGSILFISAVVGASIAFASLTFTGTNITGDSNTGIDATGTISIGASTATGITIGNASATVTIPGGLTVTGSTTTLQNLNVEGNATTTNLAITALGTSGSNCLTVNVAGNVATTTCGGSSQWTTTSTGIFYNGGNVTVASTTVLAADGTYSQVSPDTYIAQNLYEYSNTYYHGFGQVFYRAGGTQASPTYPPSSAYFMAQRFWGYDDTDPWTEAAALVFQTTEQWNSTNQGTGFFIEITPTSTTGTHRYVVMDSTLSGGISIGQPSDTAQSGDINTANVHGNLCLGANTFCLSNQAPTDGLLLQGPLRLGASVAVGSLPACAAGTLGQRQLVNNANSATPGTVAAGSGTYTIAVECIYKSSGSSYYWIID